jgi:bifunctional non-homologous end joining protein LigD
MKSQTLYYRDSKSDKVYTASVDGGVVQLAWGRRGSTMQTKTVGPLSAIEADRLFESKLAEKIKGGYLPGEDATPLETVGFTPGQPGHDVPAGRIALVPKPLAIPRPMLLTEITDAELVACAKDPEYWFQEKHDGNRILLVKRGQTLTSFSRSGRETAALPKPIVEAAMACPEDFTLDGEIIGDLVWAWDLLDGHGFADLRNHEYHQRLTMLHSMFGHSKTGIRVVQTATEHEEKIDMVGRVRQNSGEGVTIKRADAKYEAGRSQQAAMKYKFVATASVIVSSVNVQRSVNMRLNDGTELGSVTIPPNKGIPAAGSVIEVRYLMAHRGGSLSQAVYLGLRDDIDYTDCTIGQLKFKGEAQ